jgi:hypothetical protein
MDYLFQDGGKPKAKKSKTSKSKTGTKTKTATKSKASSKTGTKTIKSKTGSKKGGNFLGAVGDLVAPTGWGPFATAAGLLALDRADAALRRGKSTKSNAKKGGMRCGGGEGFGDLSHLYFDENKLRRQQKLKKELNNEYKLEKNRMLQYKETPIDTLIKTGLHYKYKNKISGYEKSQLFVIYVEALEYLKDLQETRPQFFKEEYDRLIDAGLNYNKFDHKDVPYKADIDHIKKTLGITFYSPYGFEE